MGIKQLFFGLVLLSTAWSGQCQLGGLLGGVSDVVNSAVGNVGGTVGNVVDSALSVVANVGFNHGWWEGGKVKVYNLAVANAQICTQGCTDDIYNGIVEVKDKAYADGHGPAFVTAITNVDVVGPAVYHCYKRDYSEIYYEKSRAWAIDHGYVFATTGRRFLR